MIGALEQRLGARLPAGFAACVPPEQPLPAPEGWPHGDEIDVVRVFRPSELERLTFSAYAGRIPDVAVPLARTACGNLVVVGFDGFDAGRVWLCDRSRTATAPALPRMRAALRARGLDDELDADGVVWYWERLFPAERPWRLGFADVYGWVAASGWSDLASWPASGVMSSAPSPEA